MIATSVEASKVWLITGSNRGLGRALAETVLGRGHKLVATARNPEVLGDLSVRFGNRVRIVALDVTSEQAAIDAVAKELNDTADTVDAAVAANPAVPNLNASPSA